MRALALMLAVAVASSIGQARADAGPDPRHDPGDTDMIRGCILAASHAYRMPPAVLVILLNVEGGSLGHVSANANGTVDIGPMQVNDRWVPAIAAHWQATPQATYHALRDRFCANVEAGAWILRQGLDEAHGDFWEGVGYYHSHDPGLKGAYLRAVLAQLLRLKAAARRVPVVAPHLAAGAAP